MIETLFHDPFVARELTRRIAIRREREAEARQFYESLLAKLEAINRMYGPPTE